jgi:hypothetical protein
MRVSVPVGVGTRARGNMEGKKIVKTVEKRAGGTRRIIAFAV